MPAKVRARKQFGVAIEKTIELRLDMGYCFPPSGRSDKRAGNAAAGYVSGSYD
jgi:hypothetical protein